MTNETHERYINALNISEKQEGIFLRPLSKTVIKAKVWDASSGWNHSIYGAYDMYFIKNEQGIYVGSILDMGIQDLHVFIKQEYRKQGHLTRALKEYVLPYLFSHGRAYQKITYKDEIARQHALKFGFKEIEEGKGRISKKMLGPIIVNDGQNIPLTETEYNNMKEKISHAIGLLKMAQDQVEMAYHNGGQFNSAIQSITKMLNRVEDIYLRENQENS